MGTLAVALSVGLVSFYYTPAFASVITEPHSVLAISAKSLDRKAKSDVDEVVGAGTSDTLEGSAQQAQGRAQQKLAQLTNTAEGVANAV
ncbi:MAG: hypothetical protein HC810_06530 [Acaryochloridaceae cyanobacterium RL_2_7]|nr:hypothetical protein [Acaryochloridaceae cyanobacterium RL_2_7]